MRFHSSMLTGAVLLLVLAGGVQAQGRGHDRDHRRLEAPPPPPPPPPVDQQRRMEEQQRQAAEQQQRMAEERAREAATRATLDRERAAQERTAQQQAAQLQAEARRGQSLAAQRELARERAERERLAEENRERAAAAATRPAYRYYRAGRYYYTDRYGAYALRRAVEYGYREGYRAGDVDRSKGRPFDFRDNFLYRDADYGYTGGSISLFDYSDYFREGFWRGYQDAYYQRSQYGYLFGGVPTISRPVLSSILAFGFIP